MAMMAYPARLREEQRDQHADDDAGRQAAGRLFRSDGQRGYQ
jgi:hypothetical protein